MLCVHLLHIGKKIHKWSTPYPQVSQVLFDHFPVFFNLLLKSLWLCVFVCQVGCQSFQAKSLPCSQSELISYPLERNVHDALPSPPLNGENLSKYLVTFYFSLTEQRSTSVLLLLLSAAAFFTSFFIAHSQFTGDLKLRALTSLLHLSCCNSLQLQWSVWGAHARPDRQTALSTGCPFFPLAQPITQSQYKHSFLWSTEPLWKRPFNWSSIKGAQPTPPRHQSPLCLPQPLPQRGGPSLRSPVINRTEGQS